MQPRKKALMLVVGVMALVMVLLQTACKDEEAERRKVEAQRQTEQARNAATYNQLEIEKAKAKQAERDIEVAKAKQAEENRINSDEWRALIWKFGQWVLWGIGGLVVLAVLAGIWTEYVSPIIEKRQELHDRAKNAQLYAAQGAALEEKAEIERITLMRAEAQERARYAEAKRAEEQRLIEQAKVKQLELPRLAAAAEATKTGELRRAREAEASALESKRQIEQAEAMRMGEQRLLKEAEATRAAKQAEIEKAKAVQAQRDIEAGQAKQWEDHRRSKEAEAKKAEDERLRAQAEVQRKKAEAKQEEARLAAAEIARQIKVGEYPLTTHIDVFCRQAETLNGWIENGEEENKVFDLYLRLEAALQAASKIPLEKRKQLRQEYQQINQIQTLMDLYTEKIQHVQKDETLDDEEREEKVAYWRNLRNSSIGAIQATGSGE